jgi:TetR/AcrR family transcriptional regulator, regulator of autoinduction and epiphytic fitness
MTESSTTAAGAAPGDRAPGARPATTTVDPRVERSRRVVREAALAELVESGYGAFAIDAVASRCGVARSTIYRHWPGKLALITDALETLNRQPRPGTVADASGGLAPDDPASGPADGSVTDAPGDRAGDRAGGTTGGSARRQVHRLLHHLATAFQGSLVADCLPALIEGAQRHEEVRALHHRYNAERRRTLVDAIARGVESGEIGGHVDPDLAATALAGAVIYRRFMTPDPLDPTEVDDLARTVLGDPPPAATTTAAAARAAGAGGRHEARAHPQGRRR